MRHANRPSGPGKPLKIRSDAVTEQEEIDEMETDGMPDSAVPIDPIANARHADRNAHGTSSRNGVGDNSSSGS
ncbi:MAG: hypothetical protein M3Y67_03290 [Pseudomonadota bacterium]|nr:hypothetical protein [Pseudomonadota bacterium]